MTIRTLFVMMSILFVSLHGQSLAREPQKIATMQYYLGKTDACPFMVSGFSNPENTHRWTDGKLASITFPISSEGRRIQAIQFKNTSAYVTNSHPQTVNVFLNGTKLIGTYKYTMDKPYQTIKVKIPSNMKGDAKITFQMPNAAQPSKLDQKSKDTRMLGISLSDVEVAYK